MANLYYPPRPLTWNDSSEDEIPDATGATGQYPDDVWASADYSAAALRVYSLDVMDEIPDAPSATGQYPDDVWASADYGPAALRVTALAEETAVPPSAVPLPSMPVNRSENGGTNIQEIPYSLKELDYSDDIGSEIDPERQENLKPQLVLDVQEMYQIIREVAFCDSGEALYSAVAADLEFTTPDQPGYQRRHFGLAFGFLKFAQATKHLGSLLNIMQRREPAFFDEIFGANSAELVATLNASTPEERLGPVGGEVLWGTTWMERFRRAGEIPAFQAAQNEEAIENLFLPMLPVAFELGFMTDRGLAMVFDRVVTRGLGAGLRWVVSVAGPLSTALQRSVALELLGYKNLVQFQAAAGWPPQHGQFSLETNAALVGELRRQGLIPLPTSEEMMTRLLAAASGTARMRLQRLYASDKFEDLVYAMEPSGQPN